MDVVYLPVVGLGIFAILLLLRSSGRMQRRHPRYGYIYGLYTKAEGLRYIGKTVHPQRRYNEHRRAADGYSSKTSNRWFAVATAHGDTPTMKVLKKCSYSKQDYWEKRLIQEALRNGVPLVNELLRGGM